MSRRFDLLPSGQATITGGLLRDRFERNRHRLAGLPDDGLLKRYRERAGRAAPGRYLSVWDEGRGICGGGGEFLGHWLSAASYIAAWDGDPCLRAKLEGVLAELKLCADHDGYVATAIPVDFERYTHNYYRFDKLLGGLLDAYELTGDADILHMATGTADRFQAHLNTLSLVEVAERLTNVWNDEAYGALENLVRLYELTGRAQYVDMASKLEIRPLRDDLAAGRDVIAELHSYSHTLLFIGYVRMYEATGDEPYLKAALNVWEMICRRMYVTGGNGDGYQGRQEAWRGPDQLPLHHQTQETCGSYAWIKLCGYLFRQTGDSRYLDALERTLLNHILVSQGPGRGDWAYWLPLQDRAQMIFGYCWNDPNFCLDGELCGQYYCCDGTGSRALAELPRWLFLQDRRGLAVSLYAPSSARWQGPGGPVEVQVATGYPRSGRVELTVRVTHPCRMDLRLRLPSWLRQAPSIRVNGDEVGSPREPARLASIDRVWADGDQVVLTLPLPLYCEPLRGDASRVALLYGPLVLAGLLSPNTDLHLPGDPHNPTSWLSPVADEPATFMVPGHRLHFRPLFTLSCEPYNVYFLVGVPR